MTTETLPSPVLAARQLAEDLLRPQAERVDTGRVPRSHLDALAAAGLFGLTGPPAYGGGGAARPVAREVTELLAGADAATWFVLTQHAMPLAMLIASTNEPLRERLLRPLCTSTLAGVAVANLRSPGRPAVTATRIDGGWRFDGQVGWMTSWGICDVVLLAGLSSDGQAVFALVPAVDAAGLTASPPMLLAAMQATSTVTLALDGLAVRAADIVAIEPVAAWLEVDRVKTANITPAVFGLLSDTVRRLTETASARGDTTAAELAERLRDEGDALRVQAYALIDHVPAAEQVEDRLAIRAEALELLVRSATALVTATGGSAMAVGSAPQRRLREAAFMLVQAQTGPVREATLQRLLERTA